MSGVAAAPPSFPTASTTAAGLARRARLWNFTKMTPADPRRRACTSSPKSRSSVMSTRLSLDARSITLFVGCTLAEDGQEAS